MKTPFHAELIIFDLDGTLINSIPDLTDALNHVKTKETRKPFTEEQVAGFVGAGVANLIERAFDTDKSHADFQKYFESFLTYYESHHSHLSYLYNDVIETLRHFRSKKLAILSNKLQPFTRQIVKDFRMNQYFDLVIGARDDLAKKPSAEPIHYILQKFNTSTDQAVMVGDSEADIMAAKNAEIKCVAVTYGYRSKQQLSALQPDFMVDAIKELLPIIK